MKSAPFPVGNFKRRGKKTMRLGCRCCEMFNAKWELRMKQARKEIDEFRRNNASVV